MKAALAQLISVKGDPQANMKRISEAIKEAASNGADIICFSELFYSGYDVSREVLEQLAIDVNGPEIAEICTMAKNSGIHVLICYPERDCDTENIYISSLLIDDMGQKLANHRKTYRWGDEKLKVSAGSGYEVCDTKFGKVGLLICYEIEFPEPARILALKGAEIILVSSAFTYVENMPTYLSALAVQNQCYIISTNDVRDEAPFRGSSCVIDEYGRVIDSLGTEEKILYCDIDLNAPRRRDSEPHMTDLNPETFGMMASAKNIAEDISSSINTPNGPITKKYVKKPVVIEAYQTDKEMIIHTLEGDMKAMPGDYIITGVNGEQYPCKPDVFKKTYEGWND